MAAKPKRLGKGLGSLMKGPVVVPPVDPTDSSQQSVPRGTQAVQLGEIPSSVDDAALQASTKDRVMELEIRSITPNPAQPRRVFDADSLQELSDSIKSHGLIQPILVRDLGFKASPRWELVAGERRWRAAQLAGLEVIPALSRELSDQDSAEVALIENLQREDLNVVERATALKELSSKFSLTHAEVSQRVGLDRSSVTNLLRLLELDEVILDDLSRGRLSMGHGRALLGEPQSDRRKTWAASAIEEQWSVRELERRIRAGREAATKTVVRVAERSPAVLDLERRLGDRLGTKVSIKTDRTGKKGSMTLTFYGLEHFESVLDRMGLADHSL